MENKSKISPLTCVYKISAMKTAYVNEKIEKCRNCDGKLESTCENYFPMYKTQEPIRRGVNACL